MGESYPICRDAVGVFSSPSQLGHELSHESLLVKLANHYITRGDIYIYIYRERERERKKTWKPILLRFNVFIILTFQPVWDSSDNDLEKSDEDSCNGRWVILKSKRSSRKVCWNTDVDQIILKGWMKTWAVDKSNCSKLRREEIIDLLDSSIF